MTNIHFLSYLARFFLGRKMFQKKKFVDKIKTQFSCLITFLFFENRALYEIM